MTGETGAGKSIILGTLRLLMGERTDSRCIMPGQTKCTVEGIFDIEGYGLQAIFEQNELDYEPTECILRRDIHSQHSDLLLENPAFQLSIVDVIADHPDLLRDYAEGYARIAEAKRELTEMEERLAKQQDDEDYLRFQLEQLDEFKPQAGEDEELRSQQSALAHAEEIKMALSEIDTLLNSGEGEGSLGAIDALRHSQQAMQQAAKYCPSLDNYRERLESVIIELKDIANDVSAKAEDVEYNPARLQEVTERLDRLVSLEQKHHAASSDELIALAEVLRSQLDSLDNSADAIEALKKQIANETEKAEKLAAKLSAGRRKAVGKVEKLVGEALRAMDMPAAKFQVDVAKSEKLLPSGADIVTFLFAGGKGLSLRPLADVASGGEMSRVMLALKAMTAGQMHLPTIVFDEIDTGVSGKVASSMAQIMQEMAGHGGQQVIAITHLPQIAAKADAHYFVFKEEREGRTTSHIRLLDADGRIAELAHMLSGSTVTEAAKENARELLKEKVKR